MTRKNRDLHKRPKAGLWSGAGTRKSGWGNRIESRGMVEALHRHECRNDKKGQKIFWERLLQINK